MINHQCVKLRVNPLDQRAAAAAQQQDTDEEPDQTAIEHALTVSPAVKPCDNVRVTVPQIPRDPEQWNRYSEEHHTGPARAVRWAPWLVGLFILANLVLLVMVLVDR